MTLLQPHKSMQVVAFEIPKDIKQGSDQIRVDTMVMN